AAGRRTWPAAARASCPLLRRTLRPVCLCVRRLRLRGGAAMTTAFARSLSVGQLGESQIAQWLNRRGWAVLPVYDVEMNTGKGPRLFAPDDKLIALDMFAFHPSKRAALWIEAKHKTVFTWHRISRKW